MFCLLNVGALPITYTILGVPYYDETISIIYAQTPF